MPILEKSYFFNSSERGLFVEIYFPKRAAYYGAIFVFCYLVRKFWEKVVKEEMCEDEIWVTSLFDLVLNVVKPTKPELTEL